MLQNDVIVSVGSRSDIGKEYGSHMFMPLVTCHSLLWPAALLTALTLLCLRLVYNATCPTLNRLLIAANLMQKH